MTKSSKIIWAIIIFIALFLITIAVLTLLSWRVGENLEGFNTIEKNYQIELNNSGWKLDANENLRLVNQGEEKAYILNDKFYSQSAFKLIELSDGYVLIVQGGRGGSIDELRLNLYIISSDFENVEHISGYAIYDDIFKLKYYLCSFEIKDETKLLLHGFNQSCDGFLGSRGEEKVVELDLNNPEGVFKRKLQKEEI